MVSDAPYRRLLTGFDVFRAKTYGRRPELARAIAAGQSPKVMVIACSDSRVDPALLTDAEPGELFVVRNVANIVPPHQHGSGFRSTSAAIEFAVRQLKVEHMIVLGHSSCGGIQAFMQGASHAANSEHLAPWISILDPIEGRATDPREVEQAGVRLSVENLRSFPWVRGAEAAGRLRLHGLWFSLDEGALWEMSGDGEAFAKVA
jgi:carbonic anhydrase